MRILFISPKPPDDHTCGGGVRSGFMLRALKELGDVTVVGGTLTGMRYRLKWFLTIPFLFFPKLMDRLYFTREQILHQLGLDGEKFDIVVVRYVGPMNTNAAWKIAPCYLDLDDLPSQAFDTLRAHTDCWLRRKTSVWLLGIWEKLIIKRSAGFWVCNRSQIPLLKGYGNLAYLPNVAEPPAKGFHYANVNPLQFLTVGGMSYNANSDGVDWFIDHVWPEIVSRHPDAVYNIVGGGTPEHLARKWANVPGVKLWGFVDDLAERYEMSGIVIAPIFAGSGTCIKVLEAALHGRKTVATPFGARGLDEEECRALGINTCSTIDEFLSAIEKTYALPREEMERLQLNIAAEARSRVSYERFAASVKSLLP